MDRKYEKQLNFGAKLFEEFMVDIFGGIIPGFIFLVAIIISIIVPTMIFAGVDFFSNDFWQKELMKGSFWWVLLLGCLLVSYFIGFIFLRKDIDAADEASIRYSCNKHYQQIKKKIKQKDSTFIILRDIRDYASRICLALENPDSSGFQPPYRNKLMQVSQNLISDIDGYVVYNIVKDSIKLKRTAKLFILPDIKTTKMYKLFRDKVKYNSILYYILKRCAVKCVLFTRRRKNSEIEINVLLTNIRVYFNSVIPSFDVLERFCKVMKEYKFADNLSNMANDIIKKIQSFLEAPEPELSKLEKVLNSLEEMLNTLKGNINIIRTEDKELFVKIQGVYCFVENLLLYLKFDSILKNVEQRMQNKCVNKVESDEDVWKKVVSFDNKFSVYKKYLDNKQKIINELLMIVFPEDLFQVNNVEIIPTELIKNKYLHSDSLSCFLWFKDRLKKYRGEYSDLISLYGCLFMQMEYGCAGFNKCRYPYLDYYKYLIQRGNIDLLNLVNWSMPHLRTKNRTNELKKKIHLFANEAYADLYKDESHIRLASSSWYGSWVSAIIALVTSFFCAFLVIIRINDGFEVEFLKKLVEHYSNLSMTELVLTCLLPLAILFASLYVSISVQERLHYQRMREIQSLLRVYSQYRKIIDIRSALLSEKKYYYYDQCTQTDNTNS